MPLEVYIMRGVGGREVFSTPHLGGLIYIRPYIYRLIYSTTLNKLTKFIFKKRNNKTSIVSNISNCLCCKVPCPSYRKCSYELLEDFYLLLVLNSARYYNTIFKVISLN